MNPVLFHRLPLPLCRHQSFSPSLTPRRSLLSLSCLRTSDVMVLLHTGSSETSLKKNVLPSPESLASAWCSVSYFFLSECPQTGLHQLNQKPLPKQSWRHAVPLQCPGAVPGQVCCSASVLFSCELSLLTLIGFTASLQTVLLRRSVDRTPFQLFHPSVEDMVKAEKIFCSSPSHRIEYYTSAERMEHAPTLQQPEVTVFSITSNT